VTTRAREDRSRIIHEANGYANLIVPMARDDAQQLVTAAEGYRTEKVLTAEGESDRFRSTVVGTGRGRRCNTAALTRAFALDTETPQELDSVAFVSLDPRVRLRASGRFYRPASDNQWKG